MLTDKKPCPKCGKNMKRKNAWQDDWECDFCGYKEKQGVLSL